MANNRAICTLGEFAKGCFLVLHLNTALLPTDSICAFRVIHRFSEVLKKKNNNMANNRAFVR